LVSEFEAWLPTVLVEDPLDPTGFWPEGMIELAQGVFDTQGTVAVDRFWSFVRERQIEHAALAVTRFGDDLVATTDLERPSFEYRLEDVWGPRVAYFGSYASTPLMAVTEAEVIREVSDFMQDEVIEDLHSPWPTCPMHSGAVLARVQDGVAVWLCRTGDHAQSEIGRLAR
jgi:hypothetical protein